MAKIPNGILGEFIGTAGNVSGYMRYGVNFIRTRRNKSTKPITEKRLIQQQKIKVCNQFTKPFAGQGFFSITFPANGKTNSGYNRATSALMSQAVVGVYPAMAIECSLALISKGNLPSAVQAVIAQDAAGDLVFTWTDNGGTGIAKANDTAVVLAYFTELKQVVYSLNAGSRGDGTATLVLPPVSGIAETWIGFVSRDKNDAANSVYTGRLVI